MTRLSTLKSLGISQRTQDHVRAFKTFAGEPPYDQDQLLFLVDIICAQREPQEIWDAVNEIMINPFGLTLNQMLLNNQCSRRQTRMPDPRAFFFRHLESHYPGRETFQTKHILPAVEEIPSEIKYWESLFSQHIHPLLSPDDIVSAKIAMRNVQRIQTLNAQYYLVNKLSCSRLGQNSALHLMLNWALCFCKDPRLLRLPTKDRKRTACLPFPAQMVSIGQRFATARDIDDIATLATYEFMLPLVQEDVNTFMGICDLDHSILPSMAYKIGSTRFSENEPEVFNISSTLTIIRLRRKFVHEAWELSLSLTNTAFEALSKDFREQRAPEFEHELRAILCDCFRDFLGIIEDALEVGERAILSLLWDEFQVPPTDRPLRPGNSDSVKSIQSDRDDLPDSSNQSAEIATDQTDIYDAAEPALQVVSSEEKVWNQFEKGELMLLQLIAILSQLAVLRQDSWPRTHQSGGLNSTLNGATSGKGGQRMQDKIRIIKSWAAARAVQLATSSIDEFDDLLDYLNTAPEFAKFNKARREIKH